MSGSGSQSNDWPAPAIAWYTVAILMVLIGLFGLIVPVFPDLTIMWLAAVVYALIQNARGLMNGWDWSLLVVMTLLMVAGNIVDNLIIAAKMRAKYIPWSSILLAFAAGILVSIFLTPIVGLIASPVALLVDSPDFNLRLARHLKRLGVKVVNYVSPMVWAWRPGRARKVAGLVGRMLCILPFEERFNQGTGVPARFVGHPLADRPQPEPPAAYRAELGLADGRTTVALLPGSRPAELARIFPSRLDAAERIRSRHPDVQFVVPVASTLSEEAVRPFLARHATVVSNLKLHQGVVYAATAEGLARYGERTSSASAIPVPDLRPLANPTGVQVLILVLTIGLAGLALLGRKEWVPGSNQAAAGF